MKRDKLLSSKEHWIFQIQNSLYNLIEKYRNKKNINRSQLAKEFGVDKSYISQVLNGNFDHKISKLVSLALSCNTVPLLFFVDKDEYVMNDKKDIVYDLMPMYRKGDMDYIEAKNEYDVQ